MRSLSFPLVCQCPQSCSEYQQASPTKLETQSASPPPPTYAKTRLHRKSNLDLCTETLGCENGAMCSAYEPEERKREENPAAEEKEIKQRNASPQEFPSPLTTLSGEGRLHLGRKREEGRLLLIPFKPCLLEAERCGGRLLLRLFPSRGCKEAEEKGERGGGVKEERRELVVGDVG